jgi:hypothetical protein
MKVFGIVVVVLGLAIAYIGITGSQHRIMSILKGVHLSGSEPAANPQLPSDTGDSGTKGKT